LRRPYGRLKTQPGNETLSGRAVKPGRAAACGKNVKQENR